MYIQIEQLGSSFLLYVNTRTRILYVLRLYTSFRIPIRFSSWDVKNREIG